MYGSVYCVRVCLDVIVRNLHKFEIYENIYVYLAAYERSKGQRFLWTIH